MPPRRPAARHRIVIFGAHIPPVWQRRTAMKGSGIENRHGSGRGGIGVLRRWLAAAMAWGVLGAATAAAAEVPAHWLAYARQAGETLQQRLADGSATVAELHGWMERSATWPQRQDPVVVKLWIDAGGAIERSEFASLGDTDADAALTTLLRSTRLARPPADMRQPLVLGLSLREVEGDAAATATDARTTE